VARPAQSADRALAVLDFLAAHPTESFTLSQLGSELGINVSSMHSVLSAMTARGYLVRHPTHRTYRLGPSTMAVGHAALESHPVIGVARDEMGRLADETGLESLAAAPLAGELVVVARVGRPHPYRPLIQVGERLSLIPPLGIMFVAWSSSQEIDAWLERAHPRRPDTRDQYLSILASARALGYSVGISRDGRFLPVSPTPDDPASLDLDPSQPQVVGYLATSTFDEQGHVSLVITLDGFVRSLTYDEITDLGRRLFEAALIITRATHGRVPGAAEGAGPGEPSALSVVDRTRARGV
jgi:DNA-binding IclR family transcriptional regulator